MKDNLLLAEDAVTRHRPQHELRVRRSSSWEDYSNQKIQRSEKLTALSSAISLQIPSSPCTCTR